jgi:hypothetical protein
MDWSKLLSDGGGWLVSTALVAEFLRRLMKGDIVLGREYDRVVTHDVETSERVERITAEQAAAAKEQAASHTQIINQQAVLIASLMERQEKESP